MDTDSLYMAITDKDFEKLIKPEMRKEYELERNQWFPSKSEKFCNRIVIRGVYQSANYKI